MKNTRIFRAWLQLIRLPNLFTVPGDVIAGYAIAGGFYSHDIFTLAAIIIISLLIYSSALLHNDWIDRHHDRMRYLGRPIEKGSVLPISVITASCIGFVAAILLALKLSLFIAVCVCGLVLVVISYNVFNKTRRSIGVFLMGASRAANFLLGMIICNVNFSSVEILANTLFIFYYITALTYIAKTERKKLPTPRSILFIGISPFLLIIVNLSSILSMRTIAIGIVGGLFIICTFYTSYRLKINKQPSKTPALIGQLIRNLIFIQTTLIAISAAPLNWIIGVGLLWPISTTLSQRFYGS